MSVTGTTWALELLYQMQHLGQPDDQRENLGRTYPHIEEAILGDKPSLDVALERGKNLLGIKTHLDSSFFSRQLQNPETCPRFLVFARNPKDTLVSFYYFHRWLTAFGFDHPFEVFFEMFKQDAIVYGNSIDYAASWWKYRDHPRVHFVKYEDMLDDPTSNITEIGSFLGYFLTKEEVSHIKEKTSFSAMKTRGADVLFSAPEALSQNSQFFRKGVKGDWRNVLTQEMSDYVDEVAKQRCPKGLHLMNKTQFISRPFGMGVSNHRFYNLNKTDVPDIVEELFCTYYSNVIMSAMASQITGVSIVCSSICFDADQRKHQSSASLAFVRGIHRWLKRDQ